MGGGSRAPGFRGPSFPSRFHRDVFIFGVGGWWWSDPWWYGPYWPYPWGPPGYYGYPYSAYYPYNDYFYDYPSFQGPYEAPRVDYPGPTAPQPPPSTASPDASLQIEVTPDETEIVLDGRRVGLAKEFQVPLTIPVVAGPHALELHWSGFSITETIVASPQTTVIIKRDLGPASSPASPRSPPGANPRPQN